MIKSLQILIVFLLTIFAGVFVSQVYGADCVFGGGDIRDEFKNCNPSIGIKPEAQIDLKATEQSSDFREIVATIIRRVQIITAVIAIGVIVWIGLILAFPTSAEAKENAKSKVFSVVF